MQKAVTATVMQEVSAHSIFYICHIDYNTNDTISFEIHVRFSAKEC